MKLSKNKAFAGVMSLVMAGSSFLPGVKAESNIKDKVTKFAKTNLVPTVACCFGAMGFTAAIISLIINDVNSRSKENEVKKLKESINNLISSENLNDASRGVILSNIESIKADIQRIMSTRKDEESKAKDIIECVTKKVIEDKLGNKLEILWTALISDRATAGWFTNGTTSYEFSTTSTDFKKNTRNIEGLLKGISMKLKNDKEYLDLIKNYGNKQSDLYAIADVVSKDNDSRSMKVSLSKNIFNEVNECMAGLKNVCNDWEVEAFVSEFFERKLDILKIQLNEKAEEAKKVVNK